MNSDFVLTYARSALGLRRASPHQHQSSSMPAQTKRRQQSSSWLSGACDTLTASEVVNGLLTVLHACWVEAQQIAGLVFWVATLYANVWGAALAVLSLPSWFALAVLSFQAALILLPLGDTPPAWADRVLSFSIGSAVKFFPMKLLTSDTAAIVPGRPYVVAFEPHSALPLAMPGVFCKYSGLLPPALNDIKVLASSSVFFVPGLRHAWHWLGMRPVSRKVMASILNSGGSVALCPGGVQECLHMRHGEEVVYLKRRTGFVRLAMQTGASILPAFAFGQTDMYNFWRPGPPWVPAWVVAAVARTIGYLPLIIYGVKGTPMPRRVPITVALGAPLEVPHIVDPTREQVEEQLKLFIAAMEELVETNRAAAGYPDLPLRVY